MSSKTIFGWALGLTIGLSAGAQTTTADLRPLSLQECVEMALAHNLDIQIARYSPQIVGYQLRALYGVYDPVLSLAAQWSWIRGKMVAFVTIWRIVSR